MLVIVRHPGQKFKHAQIVNVQTTENETQARYDAYCYITQDPNPQHTDVMKNTQARTPHQLTDPKEALRNPG